MKKEDIVRASIVKAAESLYQRWGILKTTMEDIAREAGKGKSTLYYYFKNKDEVFEAVAMAQAERISLKVREEVAKKKTAKEKLLTYVYTSFLETRKAVTLFDIARGEIKANKKIFQNILKKYGAWEEETLEEILNLGSQRNEFRSIGSHDVKDTVKAIMAVLRSLTIDIFIDNDDKQLIDLVIELMAEGL
ncbi:MAG: helix-turn-helix domain-containing protein [Acidobacteriota bacterium]